jgi:hypothetical protein
MATNTQLYLSDRIGNSRIYGAKYAAIEASASMHASLRDEKVAGQLQIQSPVAGRRGELRAGMSSDRRWRAGVARTP